MMFPRNLPSPRLIILLGIILLGGLYLTAGFLISNPLRLSSSSRDGTPPGTDLSEEQILHGAGRMGAELARNIRGVRVDSGVLRVSTHLPPPSSTAGNAERRARRLCVAVLHLSLRETARVTSVRVHGRGGALLSRCRVDLGDGFS